MLLMARRAYAEACSLRWAATIKAIERNLAAGDGLFYRLADAGSGERAASLLLVLDGRSPDCGRTPQRCRGNPHLALISAVAILSARAG